MTIAKTKKTPKEEQKEELKKAVPKTKKAVPKAKKSAPKAKKEEPKVRPLAEKPKRKPSVNPRAFGITQSIFAPNEVLPENAAVNAPAEIFKSIMAETFSEENISVRTELNEAQVLVFAQADAFSELFDLPLLKTITNGIMVKQVSYKRKSRKEAEAIAKASFNSIYQSEQDNARQSIPDHLMGRRR